MRISIFGDNISGFKGVSNNIYESYEENPTYYPHTTLADEFETLKLILLYNTMLIQ